MLLSFYFINTTVRFLKSFFTFLFIQKQGIKFNRSNGSCCPKTTSSAQKEIGEIILLDLCSYRKELLVCFSKKGKKHQGTNIDLKFSCKMWAPCIKNSDLLLVSIAPHAQQYCCKCILLTIILIMSNRNHNITFVSLLHDPVQTHERQNTSALYIFNRQSLLVTTERPF